MLGSCLASVIVDESSVSDTYPASPIYFRGSTNNGLADKAITSRGENFNFHSELQQHNVYMTIQKHDTTIIISER